MNKKLLRLFVLWLTAAIITALLSLASVLLLPIAQTNWNFAKQPISLATYDLFDIGVVDANSDNNLDLFTANHSAKQSLKLGNGRGEFTDVLSSWNLDQDRDFPDLEDSLAQPEFNQSGLYIYRQDKALYLHGNQLNKDISGTITLSWAVEIERQEQFEVDVRQETESVGVETTVDFTAKNNGWLVIKNKEDIIEIPHKFELATQVPLEQIHLGARGLEPANHNFDLMWRDRHTMAWTDLNRDKQLDVFIGRGAAKGQLSQVSDRLDDELMIRDRNTFKNEVKLAGMVKKDCPARQSAWVDFNGDELLDLYLVCGRNNKPLHPNQLWQQQADGSFIDVAPQFKLDFPEDGSFRWLDSDLDSDLDLLVAREKVIELWVNQGDHFESQTIVREGQGKIMNLAIADWDRDGDLDAYASSKYIEEPNLLLVNDGGSFQAVDPLTKGLPATGIDGAWVDYDNDGLSDLNLVPQGIYRQIGKGKFKATGILDFSHSFRQIANARSVWFDFDNDGSQDYLLSAKQTPPVWSQVTNKIVAQSDFDSWQRVWSANLYRNTQNSQHWLEVVLSGTKTNPQGIGALVEVTTAQGKQLQQVGNTDNSYYSQGHYRLHFGLGNEQTAAVNVRWADGQMQHLENIESDRLLAVDRNFN